MNCPVMVSFPERELKVMGLIKFKARGVITGMTWAPLAVNLLQIYAAL